MRVVTNAALIQRNRRISHISFFASFGMVAASIFLGNRFSQSQPDMAAYFNCIALPTLFFLVMFSVRMSNAWIREPVAWTALPDALRGLSNNAVIYNYILPGRHVLVAPQGVFVLFPMFQDRAVIVEDDKWTLASSGFGNILAFMRQEGLGNPTKDAMIEAEETQKLINKLIPEHDIVVQPVVVFTHPEADVQIEGEQSVPVMLATGSPSLRDYIKAQGKDLDEESSISLTADQLDIIDEYFIYES